MVELVVGCELSVDESEVKSVLEATVGLLTSRGLERPTLYYIYVYCKERPRGLIRVRPGVYVGHGVLAIKGGVLANIAFEELISGLVALSLLETAGVIDREFVEEFTKENFLAIMRKALWESK